MTDFACQMISMTYDHVAKRFVSLCEMNPFVFAGFPPRHGAKRVAREIDGRIGARATEVAQLRGASTREWRRKPLKSLKIDSR